ncbi:hypothetical protein D3Z58_23270 [Clostridiaceae bacterium]|nr:hypothetical protein [Clostridiaceae bacterium]
MGWLLELLFESVSEMCSKFIVDMMDVASGMFTEILSCDLDLFEELFGVAGDLYKNAIVPMGVALLLMILVWQLFKSMFGKLGTASEDPVELVFRSCICLFMILFAKDIVNYILEVAGTPYDWVVGTTITVDSFSEYVNTAEGVMSVLGIDVMTISVLKLLLQLVVAWNYFKMLFILAERYVLLGIFSYTSPLAFASGGSKATNNVLGSWTKMFGGQVLVVILDAWCVKMFLSAYGNMMASSYGFTKFFAANMCLIGFCKITAKLDSYMGSLGVNLGRIGGGMSGLGALLMAGRLMNFGGGRKSASGGNSGGHMNFGSGKTIPLGNGESGFAGSTASGGVEQPGGGIGGMGADSFEGQGTEFMGNGENPEETMGFGDFGRDMEPAKEENLPFGMPEEDSEMSMGPEGGEMEFGDNGVEDGPFGTAMETGEGMSGNMNFAGGQEMGAEGMAPFGQEVEAGVVEPLGQGMSPGDMEPERGGIPMEDINGMEGYGGMLGEDMALGGMFEAAEGMEDGAFGMSGEDFESGADMGSFGGSFAEGIEGFSDGMGDFEHREDGYGGAAMETGGMGYEAGGISEMEGVAEGGVWAGGIGVAGDSGSGSEDFGNMGVGNAMGMETDFAAGGLENVGSITGGGTGSGSEFWVGSGSDQNTGNTLGMTYGEGNGMAGSLVSGAGNMDGMGHGMSGMESYEAGVPGAYRMERDGEGYMRYDASRFEKPRGEYQTIHENGKTFYELPETAKAPGILPETRASLERDGTLKLEKIYREQRTAPKGQMQKQEPGKPESDGKQKVKQKRNGQGIAGNKGQLGKGHGQWKGDGKK